MASHDRRDSESIQRFVQRDGKKCPEASKSQPSLVLELGHHTRRERDAIDQRVQQQSEKQAGPTDSTRPSFAGNVRMVVSTVVVATAMLDRSLRTRLRT